jgi:hypothetical protein
MVGGCPNPDHPGVETLFPVDMCQTILFACGPEERFVGEFAWPGDRCGCGCVSESYGRWAERKVGLQ